MEQLNEQKLSEQIHGNTAIVYHTTRWGNVDPQTRDKLSKPGAAAKMPQLVVEALDKIPLLTAWVNNDDLTLWKQDILNGKIADREHKGPAQAIPVPKAAPAANSKQKVATNLLQATKSAPPEYWQGIGRFSTDGFGSVTAIKTNPNPVLADARSAKTSLNNTSQLWGFRSGSGDCYGRGFYSVFDLDSLYGTTKVGNNGTVNGYGGVVLTFYINNLSNYLITSWENNNTSDNITHPIMAVNPRVTRDKTYNPSNFIFRQLVDAGVPWQRIAKFEERCGFKSNPKDAIYNYGVSAFACDFAPYFEGYIYTEGSNDGDVLVTFDIDYILNHETQKDDDVLFKNQAAAFSYLKTVADPALDNEDKTQEELAELFKDPEYKREYELKKQEYRKLSTLATNFHNMKSIIPVSYSFDGGKTQYPIRISKEIKQKINLLRNAYSHLEIKTSERKSSPEEILRAYTRADGTFIIPYNALEYNFIKKEDITNYVANGHGDIVINSGEESTYYNKIVDILVDCKIDHVTLKPNGSGDIDLRPLSDVYALFNSKGIKCVLQVSGKGSVSSIKASADSLPLLAAITENAPVLTSEPTSNCCIYFDSSDNLKNMKAFKVLNTWITQVYLPETTSMENIDFFKRNFKALKYIYTGGDPNAINSNAYDGEVLDFKKSLIKVKPTIKSFGGIKKNGSVAFIKTLRFNMRKNKQRKAYNNLFDEQGCKDLYDICEGDIKHVAEFDQIILSPTKDSKYNRTKSCIPGSNRIGYEKLSVIGPLKVVGNGHIVAKECAMDLSCFNSLPEKKVYAYVSFSLFLPADPSIVITREMIDKAKGFTQSGLVKINVPWSIKQKVQFGDDITHEEKTKILGFYDDKFTFSKWIALANNTNGIADKIKDLPEDEELEDTEDDENEDTQGEE